MNKQQIKQILSFSLAFFLAGFIACEGPIGPEGPAGSANVTSYLFTDLEWNPTSIQISYNEDFDLSEEVRNGWLILFYVQFECGSTWVPAPNPYVSFRSQQYGAERYSIRVRFDLSDIFIGLTNPDGTAIPETHDPCDLSALRVIVGQPETVISAKMPAGFWKDYEVVAEYFGIPE